MRGSSVGSSPRQRGGADRWSWTCTVLVVGITLFLVLTIPTVGAATAPPSRPGSLAASEVSPESAVLTWTEATDDVAVIGYRVYRGAATTPVAELSLIKTIDAAALTHTADGLRAGFAYTFALAAIDADNNESPRAVTTLITPASTDTTPPPTPSSSSVSVTAFSSSRLDLVWATSTALGSRDIAYFEVLRDGAVVATVERPHAARFSDSGLSPSTSYSYAVRSVDEAGNRSSLTSARSATTLAAGAVKIVRGPYATRVDASSAVISWWTNIPTTGSVAVTGGPQVADSVARHHHQVTVTGLAPATRHSYTVTSGGMSASGSVRTAAVPGRAFTFAVIGDFGGGSPAQRQNAERIAGFGSDFMMTVGDNVYPSSGFVDPDFATSYADLDARFFEQFTPVLRTQALFPANGNKEYFGNKQFWNAFPLPGAGNTWYSLDWGDAHIVVLDTLRPYGPGSAQYAFAETQLATHQHAAWRIVVAHNPPYNSTSSPAGGIQSVRRDLVPLFEKYGVQLVLSGDSHNYQRSKPLVGGAPVPVGGVTYVLTGGGGNGLNQFSGPVPDWQAYRETSYQSLKVDVSGTALRVSAIAAANGTVLDTVTMRRTAIGGS